MTNYDPIEKRHWSGADGSEVTPVYRDTLDGPKTTGRHLVAVLAGYAVVVAAVVYLATHILTAALT